MKQIFNYKVMKVHVELYDDKDELFIEYSTNLADAAQRRVFAEQMTEAYAAGYYSIVTPEQVVPLREGRG